VRYCLYIFALFFPYGCLQAQSTIGLTGITDTSYNLNSEYRKNSKSFPFIRPAIRSYPATVRVDSNVVYCTRTGKELQLDVFYPAAHSSRPRKTILLIHGGGWRSGNRQLHHPMAEQLASMGYICITPSYRLSTEALFPAAVQDVKAAVKWTKMHAANYNIDTAAIAIAGHSAGGQLAALVGATNSTRFFLDEDCYPNVSPNLYAVIDMDGILAFLHRESGEGDDTKRISAATYWFGYSKTEKPELWNQASALTHAGPHMPPMLFMNSMVDRMHAGQSDLIRILDQYKIPSTVRVYKGAPHSWLLFHPWYDSTVHDIDRFMRRTFRHSPIKKAKQP
jgi:acetyl esterase/lipase